MIKAKILVVGCGDLGTAIAMHLQVKYEVIGLKRSQQSLQSTMRTIQADVTNRESLAELTDLKPNIIIYCVSADAQTDESYQAQYVQGLKNILAMQTNNNALQHVFFVSSTRVYGQQTQAILDESIPAIPADFGGERLLEAEKVIKNFSCNSTSMRLSGIYGANRLMLVNLAKEVNRWPSSNHWSNRIHRDDAASFISFMVEKAIQKLPVEDCYIVTDDMPTQHYEVLTWLAKAQSIDLINVKIPETRGGKRLSNKRLRATGFVLQYPNYQIGYEAVLKLQKNAQINYSF